MAINRKKDKGQEQRTIFAMLLCMGLFFGWSYFFGPEPPPPAEIPAEVPVEVPAANGTATVEAPVAAPVVEIPERQVDFVTDEVSAKLSSHGGSLRSILLPNHEAAYEPTPIWVWVWDKITGDADDSWSAYGDDPGTEEVVHPDGILLAAGSGSGFAESDYLLSETKEGWTATATTSQGVRVTKTWRYTDDPNVLEASVEFVNDSGVRFEGPLWIGSWDRFSGGDGMMARYTNFGRPFSLVDGDFEQLDSLEDIDEDGAEHFEGEVGWLGLGDRYFLAVLVPDRTDWGSFRFDKGVDSGTYGAFVVNDGVVLEPGAGERLDFQVYLGPRDLVTLDDLGHDLDLAVDFGFFGFFAKILLWLLHLVYGVLGSWGFSIIVLTLLMKAAFWPLTRKSFESGQKMKALQPQIEELKKKYGDDAQRMGQEQMKLFKDNGVNPMSGCLPMLLQMPVWIALYSALLYSADLYHAEFFYLKDLSVMDPYAVLPLIVGVMMLLQQKLTPMSPSMDPMQQKMMRLMPFMFVAIYFIFPAGLALYATVNTSLSILQMWLIRRKLANTDNNHTGPKKALAAK